MQLLNPEKTGISEGKGRRTEGTLRKARLNDFAAAVMPYG